ncbi:MAG: cation-translocating P-type ATPase, partial [Gammaproteobacteria bacterium]|nr:cation-translocating P-type ATPase [Gammaproteobacteria bacterium]
MTPPPAAPWSNDPAELAAALGTDLESGLGEAEAARRLAEHGPNALASEPPVPAWKRFAAQFRDPLIYLLVAAIVVSVVAWMADGAEGWPVEALVSAASVVLNAVRGFVQEAKASSAVAALAKMTEVTSAVLRGGEVQRIPSRELVPGDVLLVA